jgi:general secretion pathway protein L
MSMRRHQDGMALIVVLWLVVLLSIMAAGHSKNVNTDTTLAARQLQSAKARALAEAGINHVILEMLAADSDRKLPADGSLFTVRVGDDNITIAIRDATGFVDLNAAKPELLDAALEVCGVDETARRDLVDTILDWRDGDDLTRLHGVEDDDYLAAGVAWTSRDGAFEAVDELKYLPGMSQALYDRLSPLVTVHSGRGGLNMEYAPPALIGKRRDRGCDRGRCQDIARIEDAVHDRGLARAAAGRIPAQGRSRGMNVSVQRSLQPLRIRYADPLIGRLRSFWRWWSGELFLLLPENLQKVIAQRQQKLYVEVENDNLLLSLGNHAAQREVLRLALDAADAEDADIPREVQQTILLLPDDKVLAKRIALPAAAEENLREVLGFEMDLHTPFEASEVYYDYTVVGRDSARQQVTVDLVYAPRDVVDALVDSTASLGMKTDILTCRRRDNANLQPVNLLPQELRRTRRIDVRSVNLALTALLAVLLVAAITIPIVQKNRAIEAVETQLQAAAAEARDGAELRRNLEKMAEASQFLVGKKASDVMIVEVIDEISRILPDNTWIARLDLSGTELQIQGQSSASSSLIKIIESSPWFEDVRFASPVVQIAGTDNDRVHIVATVARKRAELEEQPQ